jgi:hypothetical protein
MAICSTGKTCRLYVYVTKMQRSDVQTRVMMNGLTLFASQRAAPWRHGRRLWDNGCEEDNHNHVPLPQHAKTIRPRHSAKNMVIAVLMLFDAARYERTATVLYVRRAPAITQQTTSIAARHVHVVVTNVTKRAETNICVIPVILTKRRPRNVMISPMMRT